MQHLLGISVDKTECDVSETNKKPPKEQPRFPLLWLSNIQ